MNKPKVNQISETFFEVLGHSVKIQTRKGRKLLLCSCTNHEKFCNENPFCYHKQLVLEFLSTKELSLELDKLITQYKSFENISKQIELNIILDDLERLRNKI